MSVATATLGAYPAYPALAADREELLARLAADPAIGGLEIPVEAPGHRVTWPSRAARSWTAVVTDIPATMSALADDPLFGLASPEHAGRSRALALAALVRSGVAALHKAGTVVVAVQLHSAPTRVGAADALAESLTELASWDWAGAALVVEHCDAWRADRPCAKGFLAQSHEIEVVGSLREQTRTPVGVSVNWARSVIETRDPSGALAHIRAAQHAGLLRGLMFSSVSDQVTDFGPAWVDAHLPPVGVDDAPVGTLLDPAHIRAALHASGQDLLFVGLKIGLRPAGLTSAVRAERLSQALSLLAPVPRGPDDAPDHSRHVHAPVQPRMREVSP